MTVTQNQYASALGATPTSDGRWNFTVWAPHHEHLELHLLGDRPAFVPMHRDEHGYHLIDIEDVRPGTKYLYRFAGAQERPDPASRRQPDGVHGPSELVDLQNFEWTHRDWKGLQLADSVFYELHVGTFTNEGTFNALRAVLDRLAALGITTIEIMPIAQFPGTRNWGYDGVYPFAVQNSYGGPPALQRFVDAAHAHGLAVALDVVYNHLGPEGNYLGQFGPYFSDRYRTPWGQAINFDGPQSGPVRRFFIENALFWFVQYHIDVLRLDAIHGIYDCDPTHILAELQNEVQLLGERLGRHLYLVAESNLNDASILLPGEKGGYGLPAQWSDDFHYSLHTLLTRETQGYYADFGSVGHLATVFRDGWYHQGQYSSFRRRTHGNSPSGISHSHFVVYSQNHDQTGNRARGERLSTLVDFEAQKLAAGVTLLSPFVPLLFMGEEYGEPAPFLYFTSHGEKDLIEAVRLGRRKELSEFGWNDEPPNPEDETTFESSRLDHHLLETDPHRTLRLFYHELIRFRRASHLAKDANLEITESESLPILTVLRNSVDRRLLFIFNFDTREVELRAAEPKGQWSTELYSADSRWLGPINGFPRTVGAMDTLILAG